MHKKAREISASPDKVRRPESARPTNDLTSTDAEYWNKKSNIMYGDGKHKQRPASARPRSNTAGEFSHTPYTRSSGNSSAALSSAAYSSANTSRKSSKNKQYNMTSQSLRLSKEDYLQSLEEQLIENEKNSPLSPPQGLSDFLTRYSPDDSIERRNRSPDARIHKMKFSESRYKEANLLKKKLQVKNPFHSSSNSASNQHQSSARLSATGSKEFKPPTPNSMKKPVRGGYYN